MATDATRSTIDDLTQRVHSLAHRRSRVLIGITGAPGSGKSTLAASLAQRLAHRAVVVSMDGSPILRRLNWNAWGAQTAREPASTRPATPPPLRRLRDADMTADVYAPLFRRDIEDPIAGAVAVAADVPIVITEGNYLLMTEPGWKDVRPLLDEVWFMHMAPDERRRRLIHRRVQLGSSPDEAGDGHGAATSATPRRSSRPGTAPTWSSTSPVDLAD